MEVNDLKWRESNSSEWVGKIVLPRASRCTHRTITRQIIDAVTTPEHTSVCFSKTKEMWMQLKDYNYLTRKFRHAYVFVLVIVG